MTGLIDTNILIEREDNKAISVRLGNLLKLLQKNKIQLLIHPLSRKEILGDSDNQRRNISLSKINTYPELKSPPVFKSDSEFSKIVSISRNKHDQNDNNLLFAVYANAVDFLITEDQKLIKKARKLNLNNRVFNSENALSHFQDLFKQAEILTPIAIKCIPIHNLNLDDPIFNSLKRDYDEKQFNLWWSKKCLEQVEAHVYFKQDNLIGALLILKEENEQIKTRLAILPSSLRIKIRTLIVSETGQKIGELFLRIAIDFAISKKIDEIYLTHFTKTNDRLIPLIKDLGFEKIGEQDNGEDIYLKLLVPPNKDVDSLIVLQKYFPSFVDSSKVQKFIVPIQPQFYKRLFIDNQLSLFNEDFIVEQNTITKAYLCHSSTKKIKKGDILLFYRSEDTKCLLTVGTVEEIRYGLTNPEEIKGLVKKRTVYSSNEINAMSSTPTMVILFRHHFILPKIVPLSFLKKNDVLYIPQSITEITHDNYLKIKKESNIDEHFTVH